MNHLEKPNPNRWHEGIWFKWFEELKGLVDQNTDPKIVVHIGSVLYPEDKHWSRWVLFYDSLKLIVVNSTNSEEDPLSNNN